MRVFVLSLVISIGLFGCNSDKSKVLDKISNIELNGSTISLNDVEIELMELMHTELVENIRIDSLNLLYANKNEENYNLGIDIEQVNEKIDYIRGEMDANKMFSEILDNEYLERRLSFDRARIAEYNKEIEIIEKKIESNKLLLAKYSELMQEQRDLIALGQSKGDILTYKVKYSFPSPTLNATVNKTEIVQILNGK